MQDAYDTLVDQDEPAPCVAARLARVEATLDRIEARLDRLKGPMRRWLIFPMVGSAA